MERKIKEKFFVTQNNEKVMEFNSLRRADMERFIGEIFSMGKILVIDFTLMNARFLGSFCAILNRFKWEEVYFCYTEPGTYNQNENKDYDLKNATMGYEQIPNLESTSINSTICDWVIFLGFEENRLMKLEGEISGNRQYTLPYMSIPAMKTEWHNIAMNTNRHFFELKIDDRESLEYVSAINPFETYHRLYEIKGNNNNRLVISPIGPKPVMLGCIMYVLENTDEMLLFDNPYQEGRNTNEYGKTHFYDLTSFVLNVINERILPEDE